AAGNVYVVDVANNRVQKFTGTGTYLSQWGSSGSGNGQFNAPCGVATDAAGNVYVADHSSEHDREAPAAGTYLTQWGSLGSGTGQFNPPRGVATDAAGNVYVTDDNRVQKFVAPASIALVSDVGNDQGRQVQVRFLRSSGDAPGSGATITGYEIYRRIDPLPGPSTNVDESGQRPDPDPTQAESSQLAGWTYLLTVPAHGESEYNAVVPT